MKYSKIETINLSVLINKKQCLKNLNELIITEGCTDVMPVFTNEEIVLDMDFVEGRTASEQKRIPHKSMDSAFMIIDKEGDNKEILLVEFRFNYSNMKNLDKKSLFDKVAGSELALKSPTNLHNKYIFIFNTNLKNQAIRRFRNMVPSMPKNYIATDINDLKVLYF
jgi:hypothetical protein